MLKSLVGYSWLGNCNVAGFTFGGFDPVVKKIKPLGSLVRNLNEIRLVFPAVSHGGRI